MITNRFFKGFIYLGSTLVIGALGSGLWDILFKDFFYWFGGVFVHLASSLHSGYIDRLYERVGTGSSFLLFLPSIFIILFIISIPFFVYFVYRLRFRSVKQYRRGLSKVAFTQNNELGRVSESEISNKVEVKEIKPERHLLVFMVLFTIVSISYADLLVTSVVNLNAVNVIERRLDIVRPYISENDYFLLVSESRLIDSRMKAQDLISKFELIASKNNLVLPKFELYGIDAN